MATSGETQPHSLYKWLRFEEAERSANERTRLLYVAATRAKCSLHLLARGKLGNTRMSKQSLLGRVWPQLEAQAQTWSPTTGAHQPALIETHPRTRLPIDYQWQPPAEPRPLDVERAFEIGLPAAMATTRVRDVAIGVVVHAELKRLADEGRVEQERTDAIIAQQRPTWRFQLMGEGLQGTELDAALSEVSENIEAVLTDTDGRWLLRHHRDARSEAAFTGIFEDRLTNIVVDRTFIDEDGRRWIVDYKSSTPRNDNLEAFVADQRLNHAAQLRRYREMLAAFDGRPIVAALYFTRPALLSLLD
jgi:ATP-dependent exoDNAse (exonuclease V) beta subunit